MKLRTPRKTIVRTVAITSLALVVWLVLAAREQPTTQAAANPPIIRALRTIHTVSTQFHHRCGRFPTDLGELEKAGYLEGGFLSAIEQSHALAYRGTRESWELVAHPEPPQTGWRVDHTGDIRPLAR